MNQIQMAASGAESEVDLIKNRIASHQTDIQTIVDESARNLFTKNHTLPDTVKATATGTTWYVSAQGRPGAAGNSPEDPFDSLITLEQNREKIRSGDAVLFHRGETFRGCCVTSVSGVSYGAYGNGEKPWINASLKNHITDCWTCVGDDVWTCDSTFPADVGNVILNDGEAVGFKKKHREDIQNPLDFWSDHADGNRLYIKLTDHPQKLYKSIEIAFNIWMLRLEQNSDITVENLAFCYGGGCAVRGSNCHNITVRGCEFKYIGGAFLTEFRDGTTRYGNAVEFMNGSCDITVENCNIYEIYDSGITHQGLGDYVADRICFRNNLISHCGMGSIEYWLGKGSQARNVVYDSNIMRCSGYGFGGRQRPDANATAHIQSNGYLHNNIQGFKIINNVFEKSTYDIVNIQSKDGVLPEIVGNIYIQCKNKRVGSFGTDKDVPADESAEKTIRSAWNDTNGLVCILEEV